MSSNSGNEPSDARPTKDKDEEAIGTPIEHIGLGEMTKEGIPPDQFEDKFRATKWEIWAYYA
jgi:hypothetical protein